MKRAIFITAMSIAATVLSYADDYKIIAISSGNVTIGGKICKKGDVFNDNSAIQWSSANQAMKIRNVKSGRLFRIGKSELPSGKTMSYYVKVNHTSTRGADDTNLTLEELKDEARFALSEMKTAKADKILLKALSLPTCSAEDYFELQKVRLNFANKQNKKQRIIGDVFKRLQNEAVDNRELAEWVIFANQNGCGDICTHLLRTLESNVKDNNLADNLLLANTYAGIGDQAKATAIKEDIEGKLADLNDTQRYAYLFELTRLYMQLGCYQKASVSGAKLVAKTKDLMGLHSEAYAEHALLFAEVLVSQNERAKAEQLLSELSTEDMSEYSQRRMTELKKRLHGEH